MHITKPIAVELRCHATALIAYANNRFSHDAAHYLIDKLLDGKARANSANPVQTAPLIRAFIVCHMVFIFVKDYPILKFLSTIITAKFKVSEN